MRRHRVFAFVFERMGRGADAWERPYREELCGEAAGLVLEVGAGTGFNFPHYRRARSVVGLEPEPNMLRRAKVRTRQRLAPVTLLAGAAERLPFPDGTFDTVVCSLTLCSVQDLDRAVAECRRVLRPTGRLRFYEHVRSHRPRTAAWQDRLEWPWGVLAAGCHPNRDTPAALAAHGFEAHFRTFDPATPGGRFMPHVLGEATLSEPASPP